MKIDDASKAGRAAPTRPVRKQSKAAAPGEVAQVTPVDSVSIVGVPPEELTPRVREALTSLMREVQTLRAELAAAGRRIGELERLADADPLLGVLNRRAFVRELARTIALVDRMKAPACLVFADLDELKTINDTKGHAAGDAALQHVARLIGANIRQTDSLGRLGGDEFGVILVQSDEASAVAKTERLAAAIAAEPAPYEAGPFPVRVSFGVVPIRPGANAEEALRLADAAMYKVKRGG